MQKEGSVKSLQGLFEDSLKDIYWAEKALTKALTNLEGLASADRLKTAIHSHVSETRMQVKRLEQVFELLGQKAQAKKCDAMEGLIEEAEGIAAESETGAVRDAGIIAACQKIEHYEIATYGTLVSYARLLGQEEIAALLAENLSEEKSTDEKLSLIAETEININAC